MNLIISKEIDESLLITSDNKKSFYLEIGLVYE